MATYLYGLMLPSSAARVTAARLDDVAVRVLDCGDLAALVGDEAQAPERPTLEDVRRHDDVLQAAVARGATVAAAKFGQRFADDAACRADVRAQSARVRALLERNDGCVEMRLLTRVSQPPARVADATTSPGRAYLDGLRAKQERLEGMRMRALLGGVVRDETVTELPNDAVSIAHLVRAADVDAYRAVVAQRGELSGARVVGPLPLYSFT